MSDATSKAQHDSIEQAYQNGRRFGLATGALALSIVSWFNLFGIEKSILAIVLALLAMHGAESLAAAFRRGRIALIVAALNAVTVVVALVMLRDKFGQLLALLHKLS
jgi:hypothetical protein